LLKLKHIVNGVVVSEIDMHEGDFSIGRSRSNSLQLEDGIVSGRHCVIRVQPNDYLPDTWDMTLRDLGSTNGTYVNNRMVTEQRLKHNDLIKIGSHEFKLFDDQAVEATQTEYYVPED